MAISVNIPLTAADVTALQAGNQLNLVLVPPVPAPAPGAITPPVLKVVIAQNGAVNPTWTQDYTYAAVDAKAQPGDGYGNPNGIKVTTTAPWGGFLPSNPPGQSTDFSACSELTVAINAPKGYTYSMYAILGSDTPIDAPGFTFTKTVTGWEVFTTPKAAVMTDATKGDVSSSILKACIQSKQGTTGDTFEIDNWGGI